MSGDNIGYAQYLADNVLLQRVNLNWDGTYVGRRCGDYGQRELFLLKNDFDALFMGFADNALHLYGRRLLPLVFKWYLS